MEEPVRQKRNKPCENCRSHRRKCVVFDATKCERCYKLDLNCIYKISEKPNKLYRPFISPAKRKALMETIWMLKNESDCIQLQLSQLQSEMQKKEVCTCIDPTQCTHKLKLLSPQNSSDWGLTITSKKNGTLFVQTSIRSLSDLSKFVTEAFTVFKYSFNLSSSTTPSPTGGSQLIPVTNKTLKVENAVRSLVGRLGQPTPAFDDRGCLSIAKSLIKSSQLRTQLKQSIIKDFFHCFGLVNPILTPSYFYPILMSNPDSLVATAIVAMAAFCKCQHINMTAYPFTRTQFAESCRLEAKYMLEEVLFESEASLELCIALWAIGTSSTLASKGKESRLQSSLCWNMVIQLKSSLLHQPIQTEEDSIRLETLKRLYYIVRYNEVNFRIIYDSSKNFEAIAYHSNIGLPSPLPCESSNTRFVTSVYCYRYISQLSINNTGSSTDCDYEVSMLRLFAGVLDEVPSKNIQYLENATIHIWNNIPSNLRLGNGGPFAYIDGDAITHCQDPSTLRLNLLFNIYWMSLESRLMRAPQETDLKGAALGRIDGERAILIVSICTDNCTKLFQAIAKLSPCMIKLHWLTMCIEVLQRLSNCPNDAVSIRAQTNLHQSILVLRHQLAFIESEFASCTAPAYFLQMKQIISSHMAVNKICVL